MKSFTKVLVLVSLIVGFSGRSDAQENTYQQSAALKLDFFTANLRFITSQFENAESAKVTYGAGGITLTITKQSPCKAGQVCTMTILAPTVIKLELVKMVQTLCSDLYYARTSEAVKSEIFEQIVLEHNVPQRCPTLIPLSDDGKLVYSVTGISKLTGEGKTARIGFSLKDLKNIPSINK